MRVPGLGLKGDEAASSYERVRILEAGMPWPVRTW